MFSIPLQIHPCRASLDAVLKWRPGWSQSGRSSGTSQEVLLAPSSGAHDNHGSPASPMSELRFALLTTIIIVLSYAVALTVSSLDRVLAYVGSTGSTSISFILPGLFYYKISDPSGVHHQRLTKEDDDADADLDGAGAGGDEEDCVDDSSAGSGLLGASSGSVRSGNSGGPGASTRPHWRWRRKWRWDMEHLEHGLLRRLAMCLAVYGMCVMIVCLGMNTFFVATH